MPLRDLAGHVDNQQSFPSLPAELLLDFLTWVGLSPPAVHARLQQDGVKSDGIGRVAWANCDSGTE